MVHLCRTIRVRVYIEHAAGRLFAVVGDNWRLTVAKIKTFHQRFLNDMKETTSV